MSVYPASSPRRTVRTATPARFPIAGALAAPDESLVRLSYWLDSRFEVPVLGWRFGLYPVIGLIPGVGDFLTFIPSVMILLGGVRAGVPKVTLVRMGINIALDFGLGALPFVGDLFDAWFKANQRNISLIQRSRVQGPRSSAVVTSDWLFVGVVCAVLFAVLLGAVAVTVGLIAAFVGLLTR